MEYRITPPKADGTTRIVNVDMGVTPIWWESRPQYNSTHFGNGSIIVLKIPGATQWASRGTMKYYGARFEVFRVLQRDINGNFICESLVDFPIRNK
jgi:hypothetical protein